jgi:hypothetical protein
MEIVREYRDIPRWVAEGYVRELPAVTEREDGFLGPGWTVRLEDLSDMALGGLRFRRIRLTLRGRRQAVQRVWRELEPKFYRGGA